MREPDSLKYRQQLLLFSISKRESGLVGQTNPCGITPLAQSSLHFYPQWKMKGLFFQGPQLPEITLINSHCVRKLGECENTVTRRTKRPASQKYSHSISTWGAAEITFSPKWRRLDFIDDWKWSRDAVIPGDGDDPSLAPQTHPNPCISLSSPG